MISRTTEDDFDDLAHLLFGLHALHVAHLPERFHAAAAPAALRGVFRQAHDMGGRGLVYRTEGVARGYLLWRLVPQPRDLLHRAVVRARLDHIMVSPSWRRRGLASRMIDRFEAEARDAGASAWFSVVHAFNSGSAALMLNAGAKTSASVFERSLIPTDVPDQGL